MPASHLGARRYRKPADWELVQQVAQARPELPIIGNGDVLTRFEAARRLSQPGVHAVMVGRGALIRPWIFQEVKQVRAGGPLGASAPP